MFLKAQFRKTPVFRDLQSGAYNIDRHVSISTDHEGQYSHMYQSLLVQVTLLLNAITEMTAHKTLAHDSSL